MKTIDTAQFLQIHRHLMSGVSLLKQAKIIIEAGAGLKLMEQAESEIWRALEMCSALPEEVEDQHE